MPQDECYGNAQAQEDSYGSKEEEHEMRSSASTEHSGQANGYLMNKDTSSLPAATKKPLRIQRQSSLTHPPSEGQPRTPRTPNRVRFALDDAHSGSDTALANGHPPGSPQWVDVDDNDDDDEYLVGNGDARLQAPLLVGITAPSDSPFLSDSFQPEDHLPNARPKSGMRSAFMNMANSIIGAAIVGQPYAVRQAGLTMGILLMVGLTVIVDWTICLIVINSKLSGADSFQATVQYCFGRPGLIAISLTQWVFAFGGMVAFCVVVGDTIPPVMRALIPGLSEMSYFWLLSNRRFVIVLFVMGVSWPLSLYRDIAKLSKASTLALVSMCIIILTVVAQSARTPAEERGDFKGLLFVNTGFFQAVGVISFAFVCHHNSLLIYGSLATPTLDRFSRVTHYSTAISMIACLTMALAGFLTFGSLTKGNILNNLPTDNVFVNFARFCFGLNMLTTLPLECFVCREVMNNYWFPDEPYHQTRHLVFSSALVAGAVGVSLLTCDLGAVFELFGATSASALAYILPPMCYLKLSSRSWRVVPAVLCICFGFAVLSVSLVMAVRKLASNEKSDTHEC